MTLHVVYDHKCAQCGAVYIPYDHAVPCPNCGVIEAHRFDYIPQATASLRYNFQTSGSYIPAAWWIGSLGDYCLHLLFHLFENFRKQAAQVDISEFASIFLSGLSWGDQRYLRQHVLGIALRVHEALGTYTP